MAISTSQPAVARSGSTQTISWVALACSILWVFGVGSVLGVGLGTLAVVRARRSGEGIPGVAIAAIVIGALGLFFAVLSLGVAAGSMQMDSGSLNGSGPAQ